jgi:4-hydroxy-tetrahydrodipicolinate reductase
VSDRDAVKIALFGAAGRMGREILQQAVSFPHLRIAYAYDPHHEGDEIDGLPVENPPPSLPKDVRAVMDFSAAEAVMENVELAVVRQVAYVCGVTGLSPATMQVLQHSANSIPVLHSPNMSAGMNVMFRLAELTAKALPGYDRHILEIHHTRKKDAPSGTALRLADSLQEVVNEDTPITALRMGDVTGEHTLIFGGPGERLEIVHHADSRAVFAHGALRAAEWILDKKAGIYSMAEMLGL